YYSAYIDFLHLSFLSFFFFNDPSTTEIYTLSLHDALPISYRRLHRRDDAVLAVRPGAAHDPRCRGCVNAGHLTALAGRCDFSDQDRKSTRLNSSHVAISYAVFCLKKKKKKNKNTTKQRKQN